MNIMRDGTIIKNDDESKKIYIQYCSGKWRVLSVMYKGQRRIRKQYARMSAINYDEENKVLLLRDDLEIPYDDICADLEDIKLLGKMCIKDKKCYIGSIFFYVDLNGNVISQVYSNATDNFYDMDSFIPLNDELYNTYKEELIKQIIEDLFQKSLKREKELLKERKFYENTKC